MLGLTFYGRMAEVRQTRQHWTLVGASALVGSTPTVAIILPIVLVGPEYLYCRVIQEAVSLLASCTSDACRLLP